MSVSAQQHSAAEARSGSVPPAGRTRIAEKLVLLAHDGSLIEALVSVVPPDRLTIVSDESELASHLMTGHVGVVFIDAAVVQSRPGMATQLTQRLHNELPDIVMVVAGDGTAQSELAGLVAAGIIYRFLHKPVSGQRVKLFVDAAWRKRDGGGASGAYPALSMSQTFPLAPLTRSLPWAVIGAAVIVIGAATAWLVLRSHSHGATAPTPQATPQTAAHRPAPAPIQVPLAATAHRASRPTPAAAPDLDHLATAAEQARANVRRRAAEMVAAASTAPGDTVPEPAIVTSTPPVSEARDPNSVAAVILQRVYAVDPVFPEIAREQDLSGYVDLEFTVNADGSVAEVTVLKAQPVGVFEQSAVAAVSQWRYRPIARDGLTVSKHARLRLNFAYK